MKVFVIIMGLFISILGILFLIYYTEASILQRIIVLLSILLFVGGTYAMHKFKVIIDDEEIKVSQINITSLFLRKKAGNIVSFMSLSWNEIEELNSVYILFPEFSGIVTLRPKAELFKKPIKLLIAGMPIQLIHDILSHLSSGTKIYLYPYLKRKVEGKQTWFYRR